jgi:hypothetical protein
MIIHYMAPTGEVLVRCPQTGSPREGERVCVPAGGGARFYRVIGVEWHLTVLPDAQDYYSLTGTAEVIVRVLLRDEHEEEG